MIIRALIKDRKSILLYSLIIFIVLSFVYLLIAVVLQINTNEVKKMEVIKNEERLVSVAQNVISYRIGRVVSDVLYISDTLRFHNLDNNDVENVENEWKVFSDRRNIYDQIRYIDIDGNEKIRINYSENGSFAVNKEQLQNKKDIDCFKNAIGLKKDQTYISKLDLNIENGEIEHPNEPIIGLSTPVFGSDGNLKGIVILDYYIKNTLQQFEEISSTSSGNMFLFDSNGQWTYTTENKEGTGMCGDKDNMNFKNRFPEEWNIINANKKGTFYTSNGHYSYINIIPTIEELPNNMKIPNNSIVLGEGNWVAVSFISKECENQDMIFTGLYPCILYILKNNTLVFLFIFAISTSFAALIKINKLSKERIKYFSEYDTMTGALNRRAGFELLQKTYKNVIKNHENISVCFTDINGLKEVNDNLGHDAGDELILSVVNVIKKCIRESDFIIRLGGDEFLIVFVNLNQEQSETVWNRITSEFKKINEEDNRKYIISVSHGIEEFKFNSNEYIDNIINSADEKMYSEKKVIKKDLDIIKKIKTKF